MRLYAPFLGMFNVISLYGVFLCLRILFLSTEKVDQLESLKKKVIIDCDPGIDDALALLYALNSKELEIIGITIVCGNVPTALGAQNALKVLKRMERLDIPVYLGEEKPLRREFISAQDTHGLDGLGETNFPEVTEVRPQEKAVDFIIKTLETHEDVLIIALGPLTNIANALMKRPNAFMNLSELVSMGGNYRSFGNCSPVAEYNYWCDPDAAQYVYENLTKKISMVGLDVTRKIVLTPNLISYMKRLNPEVGTFVEDITGFYHDFHWTYEHLIGCVINDPLAVAYAIDRSLCEGFEAYTTVETEGLSIGQSIVDAQGIWKKEPNSTVLTKVNATAFLRTFIARLCHVGVEELDRVFPQILAGDIHG